MKNLALCFLLIFGTQGAALAGDPVIGKQKADVCIACHGDNGAPGKPGVPKIDRMSSETFKSVMEKMREVHHDTPITAHALNDQDLEDIAAYFSFTK